MPEETEVATAKVTHKGLFKFKEYYDALHRLLTERRFTVDEKGYKHKETAEGTREVEIKWEAERKVDDYTKLMIKADTLVVDLREVKVKRGEEVIPMDEGTIELKLTALLITDYAAKWETHPILKFLKGVYDRYIYRPILEHWKREIWRYMYEVEGEIKAFFRLLRFRT